MKLQSNQASLINDLLETETTSKPKKFLELFPEVSSKIKTPRQTFELEEYIEVRRWFIKELEVLNQECQFEDENIEKSDLSPQDKVLEILQKQIPPEKKQRIHHYLEKALSNKFLISGLAKHFHPSQEFPDSNSAYQALLETTINISSNQEKVLNEIERSVLIPESEKPWVIYQIITKSIIPGKDAYHKIGQQYLSYFENYTILAGSFDPLTYGHFSIYKKFIEYAVAKRESYLSTIKEEKDCCQRILDVLERNPSALESLDCIKLSKETHDRLLTTSDISFKPAILIVKSGSKDMAYQTLSLTERAYVLKKHYGVTAPIILGGSESKEETKEICGVIQGKAALVIKGYRDLNDLNHTQSLHKWDKYGQFGALEDSFVNIPSSPETIKISSGLIKGKLAEYFLKNGWKFDKEKFLLSETYQEIKNFAPKEVLFLTMKAIEEKIRKFWIDLLESHFSLVFNTIITEDTLREIEGCLKLELKSTEKLATLQEYSKLDSTTKEKILENISQLKQFIHLVFSTIKINDINGTDPQTIDNNEIKKIEKTIQLVLKHLKVSVREMVNENFPDHPSKKKLSKKISDLIFPNKAEVKQIFTNLETKLEESLQYFLLRLSEDSGSIFDGKQ